MAVRAVTGTASVDSEPYGTDAAKLSAAGIASIVLGPRQHRPSARRRGVGRVRQVLQAVEVYHRLVLAAGA